MSIMSFFKKIRCFFKCRCACKSSYNNKNDMLKDSEI